MSKQTEDTMYAIYEEVERLGLRKEFERQMKKIKKQSKWKWKSVCERQEHALMQIKK